MKRILILIFTLLLFTSCTNKKFEGTTNIKLEKNYTDVDIENDVLYGLTEKTLHSLNLDNKKTKEVDIDISEYSKIKALNDKIYIFTKESIKIYNTDLSYKTDIKFSYNTINEKIQKIKDKIYFFADNEETEEREFFVINSNEKLEKINVDDPKNYLYNDGKIIVYTKDKEEKMKKVELNTEDRSVVSDTEIFGFLSDNLIFDKNGKKLYTFDYQNAYEYDYNSESQELVYSFETNNFDRAILDNNNMYFVSIYENFIEKIETKNLKPNFEELKIFAPFEDFTSLSGNFIKATETLIENHPGLKVRIIYNEPTTYYEKLNVFFSSKDDEYDMVYVDGYNALSYIDKGVFLDLSKEKNVMKNINENVNGNASNVISSDGYYFGVPQAINVKPLKVNITRLNEMGISFDAGDEFTYDEYFEIMDKIKKVDIKYYVQNSLYTYEYLNYYIASHIDVKKGISNIKETELIDVLSKIKEYNDAETELQNRENIEYDESERPVFTLYGEGYINKDDEFIITNTPIEEGKSNYIAQSYIAINRASKNTKLCTELFSYFYDKDIVLSEGSFYSMPLYKDIQAYNQILLDKYSTDSMTLEEIGIATPEYEKIFNSMLKNSKIDAVNLDISIIDEIEKFYMGNITKEEIAKNIYDHYKIKLEE